ncbi:ATPase, histidine kinase-, DNA gyrase B (macronuclear) [Tetrahymena thermophila SB210]|uniref:ATPase, histidine kinase-, DNA gyrase B n=1 Tax=Tetrahymena thermophila (strain SB210) TaxID=312017 RepID=Q22NF7_TETTS|nr:ATPase, histidine kinase-, DNA gyrase B [Tetrahymena thermophila SB210]EAR86828.2 ATPase, histidine kinase-, DNA gyrase B [Tetrahymena thermophila SB210]|eukprot:XP_001007073.2 ATPase, histidine kinase-, DNA gyrase B [Tetrahymena thermophila SB210]
MEQKSQSSPQAVLHKETNYFGQVEDQFMQNQNLNGILKQNKLKDIQSQQQKIIQSQKKQQFKFFTPVFMLWIFINSIVSIYNQQYINLFLSIYLGLILIIILTIEYKIIKFDVYRIIVLFVFSFSIYLLKTLIFDFNSQQHVTSYPYWLFCGIFLKHFCRYIEQWYFKCILISFSCIASIFGTNFNELNMFLTHTYLLAVIVCFSFYVETRIENTQYIDFINQIKILKGQKDLLDILIPSAIFVCQLEDNQSHYQENNHNFSNIFENTRQQMDLNNTKGYSFKREEISGINSFQNQSQFVFPSALKSLNPMYKTQQQKHVKIDYANKNSLNIFEVERSQEILEKLQYMIQEEADQEKNPSEISFTLYSKIKQQLFAQSKNVHNIKKTMNISGQIEIMNIVEDKCTYKYGQSYFNVKYVNCFWNQQPSLLVLLVNVSQEKRNQQLQQMNTYKDRLLATVSHDLKTPLNCIISLTGQIKEMNIVSIAQNVDIIYNNSLMLLFMIKDILDYSQIMHKKLKLSSEKINLQQCIKEVFDIFQFQCSSQNIDLIQQVEDITFYNDKNRLKQIIINFVSNAIKFTKQGFVTVKAVNQDDCVRISVGDTGTGMSDEVVKKLFKEYETFDNKDKMNQQGIGLGLFICKNLVGALGPDDCIKVESTVGLGSTFTFDIYKNEKKTRKKTPTQQINSVNGVNNRFSLGGNTQIRSQNPSIAQNRPNPSKTLQTKEGKTISNQNQTDQVMDTIPQEGEYDQIISTHQGEMIMSNSSANLTSKILAQKYKSINSIQNRIYKMNKRYNIIIVDDSKYNLIALKIYLNDYKNFDVEEFIHAEKALQRIKEQEKKYDIVFTDLQMPFMDGFELTKQIRQMQNRIQQPKIVIVTADSSDFLKIKSSQYAVNDYIEKPITDKDLFRSKIMKLLE